MTKKLFKLRFRIIWYSNEWTHVPGTIYSKSDYMLQLSLQTSYNLSFKLAGQILGPSFQLYLWMYFFIMHFFHKSKTVQLKVENSAQTTLRSSPISFCTPLVHHCSEYFLNKVFNWNVCVLSLRKVDTFIFNYCLVMI